MRPAWQEGRGVSWAPRARLDGWSLYLLFAIALAPVVVPAGPVQTALVDLVNLIALPIFAATVLVRRRAPAIPLLIPAALITAGSLIATFNSLSGRASTVTLLQDAYLFAWFVLLVNVLRDGRDLTRFRVTWLWVANAIALYALLVLVVRDHQSFASFFQPRGARASGTFYDPNMCADYLVLSLFLVLSLGQEVGRLLRWGSIALLLTAIVATKSNGGLTSLAVGGAAWMLARAWTLRLPPAGVVALGMMGIAVVLGGLWMVKGFGLGEAQLTAAGSKSVLGRAGHSSEGRFRIWQSLLRHYAEKPLGIGPGNSVLIQLPIEERERPNSLQSKEAHNDYLAYLIERGPLALLGLLVLKLQLFGKIVSWWRRRRESGRRTGGPLVAGAVGALVAASVHSLTVETLHFRHVWLFVALLCSIEGMSFQARRERRSAGEPAPTPGGAVVAAA